MTLLLTSLFLATAHAVPVQTMHQGRLLDEDGVAMEGEVEVTFRLIDADTGGTIVWEETSTLTLTHGFYISILGADEETNPLDTEALDHAPLWLEMQLTGEPAMFPRSPVTSVPYSRIAGVAEEVAGGPVDASEVRIAGEQVIDEDGVWVGSTPEVGWTDLSGVPLGFSDDLDADSLAEFVCEDGEVIRWAGTGWACGEDVDTWLSDEEVQAAVAALPLDFAAGSTVGGRTPLFTDDALILDWTDLTSVPGGFSDGIDDDTQLSESAVEGYITDDAIDLASGSTIGGAEVSIGAHTSSLGWSDITGVPDGFADGIDDDTRLSESDVETYVTNGIIDLATGTTVGGESLATGSGVPSGVIVMWSGSTEGIPGGWALCDGGDGRPNLTNRFILSSSSSGDDVGTTGGVDTITLTEDELPSHGHGITDPGHNHSIQRICGSGSVDGTDQIKTATPCGTHGLSSSTTGISLDEAGGGESFDNRPAFYTLAFIIKL